MVIHDENLRYTVTIRIYKVDGKYVARVESKDELFSDDLDLSTFFDNDTNALIAELDAGVELEEAEEAVRNDAA